VIADISWGLPNLHPVKYYRINRRYTLIENRHPFGFRRVRWRSGGGEGGQADPPRALNGGRVPWLMYLASLTPEAGRISAVAFQLSNPSSVWTGRRPASAPRKCTGGHCKDQLRAATAVAGTAAHDLGTASCATVYGPRGGVSRCSSHSHRLCQSCKVREYKVCGAGGPARGAMRAGLAAVLKLPRSWPVSGSITPVHACHSLPGAHVQGRAPWAPTNWHRVLFSECKAPNPSTCHGRRPSATIIRPPRQRSVGKAPSRADVPLRDSRCACAHWCVPASCVDTSIQIQASGGLHRHWRLSTDIHGET
jgi:hypothetical protein